MNKKFKNRNRGLITFGIVALSAVALTASGFAAWVISGTDTQTADGSIVVDTVTNNNHTINVALTNKDIVYGSTKDGNVATWLKNDDTAESLTATATVTVSNVTTTFTAENFSTNVSSILSTPTITVIETNGGTDAMSKWNSIADGTSTVGDNVANGLVAVLPTLSYTFVSYSDNTLTCSISIVFKWGKLFGSVNPCNYYADKDVETYGTQAQTYLTKLRETLNGCSYRLTVKSL